MSYRLGHYLLLGALTLTPDPAVAATRYQLTGLGHLDPESRESQAWDVNNAGVVVGWDDSDNGLRGFVWESTTGIEAVGDLPGGTADDLNKIVAACLQARETVNKLRLFARQAPIQTAWVDVAQVVDEALSLVKTRCVNQGIEVVRRVEAEPCETLADQVQLKQVVVNLVVNSIHAMPGGGMLTVVIRRDDSSAIIEVQDTGMGMTEEVVDQIFNPFFTTKDVGEGTGLGLCVVHGIVTAHGGTIDVESEVGRGSRFTVRFPFQGNPGSEF